METPPPADPTPAAAPPASPSGVRYCHAQVPEYRDASELFVLTDTEILLASSEDKEAAPAVKQAIDGGAEPATALREGGFDADDVRSIPLSSVRHVVSYGDESELRIHHTTAEGKEKEHNAWLTNRAATDAALAALKPALGGVNEHEEESSLLHVGTLPLVGIGFAVLLGIASVIASMLSDTDGRRRNAIVRAVNLLNFLGTPLTLLIAALIIAGMVAWWFVLGKDRPMKKTLTPSGRGG